MHQPCFSTLCYSISFCWILAKNHCIVYLQLCEVLSDVKMQCPTPDMNVTLPDGSTVLNYTLGFKMDGVKNYRDLEVGVTNSHNIMLHIMLTHRNEVKLYPL